MMAEVDKWSIDKMDSSNWMMWKFQIKHLLLVKDLWGFIEGAELLQEDVSAQQRAYLFFLEGILNYSNVNKFVTTLPDYLL